MLEIAFLLCIVGAGVWWTFKRLDQPATSKCQPLFQTPLPSPAKEFDLATAKPLAYRPFRHGPNFVTLGIRKMDWNHWIEMDSDFPRYHDLKEAEIQKDCRAHIRYVDNSVTRDACFEMLEELAKYLSNRYPTVFKLDRHTISNKVTGEVFQYPAPNPTEALKTAAKLVQDDLVLMIENDDDQYHIDAAAVCLPGFWRLEEKFRMSLDTLRFEANVPHYGAKLQKPMNRFFKNLSPEKPVIRNNFFIQLDDGLHWSHRMGSQNSDQVASWATADSKELKLEELHFRSERQSLRRLPHSGALMFTIRTYFEPVVKIAKEPHVPGRLAEAIRQWDNSVAIYKGKAHWESILLPFLDEQHELQQKSGVLDVPEAEFPY